MRNSTQNWLIPSASTRSAGGVQADLVNPAKAGHCVVLRAQRQTSGCGAQTVPFHTTFEYS